MSTAVPRFARALVVLAFVACGGSVVIEEGDSGAGGQDGAGGSTTAVGTTGPSATSADSVGVSSGGSGGGASSIVATITEVSLEADCMPEVSTDPVTGSIAVDYENVGDTWVAVDSIRIDLTCGSGAEGWVFPIVAAPEWFPPFEPGMIVFAVHVKSETPGDASFICSLCGQEGTVVVRGTDDTGLALIATAPFRLACAL